MKVTARIALPVLLLLCILTDPLYAADLGPIFPKQGAAMVATPNITWAADDYDYFVLYLRLPIPVPGYWYRRIPVPRYQEPYWRLPDAWWDLVQTDGWCLWRVLAVNTTTHAYELTSWQYFQKVDDCLVDFSDANFERVVREEIGEPFNPITASQLMGITKLRVSIADEVSDIGGIEYCSGLRTLLLDSHLVSSINPLAGLADLESLSLGGDNPVDDLSPIAGLTHVEEMVLAFTQIKDIGPLANLVNMRELMVRCPVVDLSPLADLANLRYLTLNENQVEDIAPLSDLAYLQALRLSRNQIQDISPLEDLVNLTLLELDDNQIEDITPLAGLTNLSTLLDLSGNQISDITAIGALVKLKDLDLGDNQIVSIEPLAGLTELWTVWLHNNQISDIRPLVDNPGFRGWDHAVNLSANPLSNTSCAVYIPTLEGWQVTVYHSCPPTSPAL